MDLVILIDQISMRLRQTFSDLHEACQAEINRQQELAELKKKQLVESPQKESPNNEVVPENKESKQSKAKYRKLVNSEKPKKYVDAFSIYMKNLKASLFEKEQNLSEEDLIKIANKKWQHISENEKQPFYQEEEDNKKRYEREMESFYDKFPQQKPKNVKTGSKRERKNQKKVEKKRENAESEEKNQQMTARKKESSIEEGKQQQQKKEQNDQVNQYLNLNMGNNDSDSLGQQP